MDDEGRFYEWRPSHWKMENPDLIPHLFRTEYRKIVSVLVKRFGFEHIERAEDIASDTFLTAAQTWALKGIPENPTAWLYQVAKNKAKNDLQRLSLMERKIAHELTGNHQDVVQKDLDLSPHHIHDSQLQMMFAICDPSIPPEAQIGLSLRILCGFGIEEIADAFLTNKETINKRLYRAKDRLRESKIKIEAPSQNQIEARLPAVMATIYLLFNEGYYSESHNNTLRKDVCLEAMRLCQLLLENETTRLPAVNALMALMCFHASRFDARVNPQGELVLYEDQDTTAWNEELIAQGTYFMKEAATGDQLSRYHLEGAIAYWHTRKEDTREKWEAILQLYNQLLQLEYSPMAALNRTFALAKARGNEVAIMEAEKLKLEDNHFYHLLLGELYSDVNKKKAREHFERALEWAKTHSDRKSIQTRLDMLI